MGNILIIAEISKGQIKKTSLPSFTFGKNVAAALNGEFHLMVIGEGVKAVAGELNGYGAKAIHVADHPALGGYTAEAYAKVVADVAQSIGATLIGTTATTFGKDLIPRLAAKLNCGMASDIIGFSVEGGVPLYRRPAYAGNAIVTVKVTTEISVVTIRATEFEAPVKDSTSAELKDVAVEIPATKTRFVAFEEAKSDRPELTEARVIVSGGRGLKDAENFKTHVYPLADFFNAAIGATRAAVDAGWTPNDWQVGQTGKIVAPDLYFAVGLSGAIQHLAGMKGSKVIVAINKDPEAPIFQVADYGLVADLFKAVPELLEEMKKAKS